MIQTLKTYFGYDSFRPLQEEIIHNLISKKRLTGIDAYGGEANQSAISFRLCFWKAQPLLFRPLFH